MMASVFKKTATKPLPVNAEIITRKGKRLARWKDGRGKNRTAAVTTGRDGTDRIVAFDSCLQAAAPADRVPGQANGPDRSTSLSDCRMTREKWTDNGAES